MRSGVQRRKEGLARLESARQELYALRGALTDAYCTFNRTADPALLEASILEISALQVRCDRLLRSIKEMNGELQNDPRNYRTARHRGGTRLPADQTAEKTNQMGV